MNIPPLGQAVPQRGHRLSRAIGQILLKVLGWQFAGEIPNRSKLVIIGAPHTSNWDFPVMMGAVFALGIRLTWMGKHTLFRPPYGWLMRRLGGLPIDRTAPHGVVEQTIAAFEHQSQLFLVIAPEGTRKKVDRWKTGFYHIAVGAGVPILPAYLDFKRKVIGFGPLFTPTGQLADDIARLQAFYQDKTGKRPAQSFEQ